MRYGEIKYGDDYYYGADTDDRLHWGAMIYWKDDNAVYGDNEAGRLLSVTTERGRDGLIQKTSDGLQFPIVGRAVLTLDNSDGRFNPWNTSSPLYGYIEPGKYARVFVRNGSSSDNDYHLITGIVSDITPLGKLNEQAQIVIEEGINWLIGTPVSIGAKRDVTIDQAVGYILDGTSWPEHWGRDLETSPYTIPFWWTESSADVELLDLMQTDYGYFCQRADGRARYVHRTTETTDAVALTDANTLDNVALAKRWENYKNIVRANYIDVTLTEDVEVVNNAVYSPMATYGKPQVAIYPYTYNGETEVVAFDPYITYIALFFDYVGISSTDFYALVGGYSSFDFVFTDNATSCTFNYWYNYPTGFVLITNVNINGTVVPKKTEYTSIAQANAADYANKPRYFNLNLPWCQTSTDAQNNVDTLVGVLSSHNPYPIVQVEARPEIQFKPDLFDTVTYDSTDLGISDTFRVGKIMHEWLSPTGQAVRTTFNLEPFISS